MWSLSKADGKPVTHIYLLFKDPNCAAKQIYEWSQKAQRILIYLTRPRIAVERFNDTYNIFKALGSL